ncbi:hypothetical protein ARMGADRAFT_1137907 [Armillaria gallica]|uniref:Uncharacterized protein n=1 Tax=Armillaria gallica TaxID=47427 RepID=A0A2H3CNG2_ARMGA|nr:hypothetical protein ARMGADRAFT_1137907 [Armillaria gallica]
MTKKGNYGRCRCVYVTNACVKTQTQARKRKRRILHALVSICRLSVTQFCESSQLTLHLPGMPLLLLDFSDTSLLPRANQEARMNMRDGRHFMAILVTACDGAKSSMKQYCKTSTIKVRDVHEGQTQPNGTVPPLATALGYPFTAFESTGALYLIDNNIPSANVRTMVNKCLTLFGQTRVKSCGSGGKKDKAAAMMAENLLLLKNSFEIMDINTMIGA